MSDNARSGTSLRHRRTLHGFPISISLCLVAFTITGWLVVPDHGGQPGLRAAAESGLQSGDVILDVDRSTVDTPADVAKIVGEARAQSKRAIPMRIKRGDSTIFVGVPIG
jgi:membrane-associated protease RseP (regulator of RpoE activity)